MLIVKSVLNKTPIEKYDIDLHGALKEFIRTIKIETSNLRYGKNIVSWSGLDFGSLSEQMISAKDVLAKIDNGCHPDLGDALDILIEISGLLGVEFGLRAYCRYVTNDIHPILSELRKAVGDALPRLNILLDHSKQIAKISSQFDLTTTQWTGKSLPGRGLIFHPLKRASNLLIKSCSYKSIGTIQRLGWRALSVDELDSDLETIIDSVVPDGITDGWSFIDFVLLSSFQVGAREAIQCLAKGISYPESLTALING